VCIAVAGKISTTCLDAMQLIIPSITLVGCDTDGNICYSEKRYMIIPRCARRSVSPTVDESGVDGVHQALYISAHAGKLVIWNGFRKECDIFNPV
jgi:hypothetical protein